MLFISVEKSFTVSQVCEALCYGFFMCIFVMSVYTHFRVSPQTTHTKILFVIACAMFIVATSHFVLTFHRTLRAMEKVRAEQDTMATFSVDPHAWNSILRNVLYVTQCLLGDSVAIYRCWILWDRDLRVIALPIFILAASSVSGYMACVQLSTSAAGSIFDSGVRIWVALFYSLAVGQTLLTTTLLASRLWWIDRRSLACTVGRSRFISTMLLLVESAALYFVLQIVALTAFLTKSSQPLMMLGSIPPIIGIAFTLVSIRVAFLSRNSESGIQTLTIGSVTTRQLGTDLNALNHEAACESQTQTKTEASNSPV
ncbi:hypothetical protein C8J57DRAFT_186096 [Mycena rebaudengoi]|nr:hypothetical protein C8J57DRAFT_186096 [Mycena rebaudengoi]